MDATIILLWVVVLLILHLLVEKSLQMKTIAETFMNTDHINFRDFQSMREKQVLTSLEKQPEAKDDLEDQLVNFLMNGEASGFERQRNGEAGGEAMMDKQLEEPMEEKAPFHMQPASGHFKLQDHTNFVKPVANHGRFANLHTYDSLESTEAFSSPM